MSCSQAEYAGGTRDQTRTAILGDHDATMTEQHDAGHRGRRTSELQGKFPR